MKKAGRPQCLLQFWSAELSPKSKSDEAHII